MSRRCVYCKYFSDADPDYFICNNPESDAYDLEVMDDDSCEEFVDKDEED